MSTSITATAGFFLNDVVSPDTATDLDNAVAAALANVNAALGSETAAAASALAAAASATSAAASQNASSTNATTAGNGATNATAASVTATTQATGAAASATAASTSATAADSSATAAAGSATAAASSATAAANSASTASTQATNAATSATAAAASVSTLPAPSGANELNYVRVTSVGNAYEARTPAQVPGDIGLSAADTGRNKIHNPLFNIAQRGVGAFTTNSAYTLDRWYLALNTDTVSNSQQAFSDGQRASIGDEEAVNASATAVTGSAGAAAFSLIAQNIENVRRLANKTVTVSFWAHATAGTPNLGVGLRQFFGTGGSPSTAVDINASKVVLSTTPTRYTVTISLASVSGKTLGTNGDSYTRLAFFFSSGATNNTLAGSVGVQSATFVLWGVQLEVGPVATALEKPDPQQDLAKCQRFFLSIPTYVGPVATYATSVTFPATMRATPSVSGGGSGYSALLLNASNVVHAQTTAAAQTLTFTADL